MDLRDLARIIEARGFVVFIPQDGPGKGQAWIVVKRGEKYRAIGEVVLESPDLETLAGMVRDHRPAPQRAPSDGVANGVWH